MRDLAEQLPVDVHETVPEPSRYRTTGASRGQRFLGFACARAHGEPLGHFCLGSKRALVFAGRSPSWTHHGVAVWETVWRRATYHSMLEILAEGLATRLNGRS